jgi:cytochrome o ubiquinol oxidase subunit 1
MTAARRGLTMVSLFVGEFAQTGWLAYPPLSGITVQPRRRRRLLHLVAADSGRRHDLAPGINLIGTIVKMRAPGMGLMKMPVFTWTALCTNVLIVASLPGADRRARAAGLDRYVGTNFFTNDFGGNADDVREPDLDLGPP